MEGTGPRIPHEYYPSRVNAPLCEWHSRNGPNISMVPSREGTKLIQKHVRTRIHSERKEKIKQQIAPATRIPKCYT